MENSGPGRFFVVMVVGAIILGGLMGSLLGPSWAWLGGFLAFLIACGDQAYSRRRNTRKGPR